ncbi:flagellar basal body P-ring formation chaperone FlgA [Thalassotalea sp. PLHSN55]|uniref:flagellar basal body P-ring formation chaperone FlgA n=1 Tax=Thalassotalea sp. PLHSN55 TaxID=3435888 RepID=UPI003F829716
MINIQNLAKLLFSLLLLPSFSHAAELDRAYIENFAKNYLTQQIATPDDGEVEISVSTLDPRIVIKPCQSPLVANIPEKRNSRNVNVKISCSDSTPWHIYINAKVKTMLPVLVATTRINKGSILDDSNIKVILKDQSTLRGETIANTAGMIGAKTKRNINKGAAITKRNICLVCKGENVTIIAKSNSFTLKTAGIALSSGSSGDQVSVKNVSSGRTVSAQVMAINKVVVTL